MSVKIRGPWAVASGNAAAWLPDNQASFIAVVAVGNIDDFIPEESRLF